MQRLRLLRLTVPGSLRTLQVSQRALSQLLGPSRKMLCVPPITAMDGNGNVIEIPVLAKFSDLPDSIPDWLKSNVEQMGFKNATPIQGATMPFLLDGRDVVGLAPTGSGKTAAFAIPALARFKRNRNGNPAILVIAPVRELVQQTTKVFRTVGKSQVITCEAYGGTSRGLQARDLQRGCDVLVACPGRLTDFLKSGTVSLDDVRFLVLDEADRLLDMGFQPQIDEIMQYCAPEGVQVMMWSATWPTSVQRLAQAYLSREAVMVRAGDGFGQQINADITQHVFVCRSINDKGTKLRELASKGLLRLSESKVIVFVKTQADCEGVAAFLSRCLEIDPRRFGLIHGGMEQDRRDHVISDFKNGKKPILVATDVASRGLDISDVQAVINFSPPNDIDSYCHRIGRTGRAGRKGSAFTFVDAPGAFASSLVEYLERCKQEVPSELREMGRFDRFSSGSSRFGSRGRGRGRGRSRFGDGRRDNFHGGQSSTWDKGWDEDPPSGLKGSDTFDSDTFV